VEEVSERCALTEVRKKLISKLSRGYRQRVGLADALCHKLEIGPIRRPGLDLTAHDSARHLGLAPETLEEIRRYTLELYEAQKNTLFKGKTLAQVERELARDMIASEKTEEIRSLTDELAGKVKGMLSASDKHDAAINALLKPYGIEVGKTPALSRSSSFVPGAGEVRELVADAFRAPSPIDAAQGGKPKVYPSPGGSIVALVVASEKPDMKKLDLAERVKIVGRLSNRKESALSEARVKRLNERAKVKASKEIVGGDEEG